jgi:hypothetical protein
MRLIAAITVALSFAALLCARYLSTGQLWYASLYALPLFATLAAVAVASSLLEHLLGQLFRAVAPALGLALALFAVLYAIYQGAPGVLPPGLPLEGLRDKALSIAALAAAGGALALGSWGLRAPYLASQVCATLALGGAALALRESVVGFGLPFLSRFSVGMIALAMPLFVISAFMRQRRQAAAPPPGDEAPPGEPPTGAA